MRKDKKPKGNLNENVDRITLRPLGVGDEKQRMRQIEAGKT